MTLAEAVARLRTRVRVDLEAEVDLDDNEVAAEELVKGAKRTSRDAYLFWKMKADLTLGSAAALATAPEYNLLDPDICASLMFHIYDLHVNGDWITRVTEPEFEIAAMDYHNETAAAKVNIWCPIGLETVRISPPLNSTGYGASDNFARGFIEYPTWDYGNYSGTEMLGAPHMHDLYVDNAALAISVSYVASTEGLQRRAAIERNYSMKVFGGKDAMGNFREGLQGKNLERVRPLTRKATGGLHRRVFTVGHRW